MAWPVAAADVAPPTVLHVAGERHTALALNYAYFPQFAQLGFGTPSKPWHPWFGTQDIWILLHLPDYQPGQPIEVMPSRVIGSRFRGQVWTSGFEALRSFDTDQNDIVERDELNDLYVWMDRDSSGTVAPGQGSILPCHRRFAGFDLRKRVQHKQGYARPGRLWPFAAIKRKAARSHLLELAVEGAFATQTLGYLSYTSTQSHDPAHAFSGEWQWTITNAEEWGDNPPTWGQAQGPAGRLILAADGQTIRGVVQYLGRHADRINLPLEGRIADHQAEWTSVSPLGLTRSLVTLSQELGIPVLVGTAWSNRNGKLQRWMWKAYYEKRLE